MAARKKTSKKSAPRRSKKKVTRKKVAKKTAKKSVAKKKTSKKKVAKKKATKKTSKKKAAKKTSRKTVSKKKTSKKKTTTKKSASVKKAPGKKATGKKALAKKAAAEADTANKPIGKRKIAAPKIIVKRPARIASHALINPADQRPARPKRRSKKIIEDLLIHGIQPYQKEKGEEYMSELQLAHFRKILTAWKTELMEEVDRTVHHMQDEASNFPDPNDRATQESEFGLELRTRDRERKLLKKIDQAIARTEDASYGYCEKTGEEIGLKRLEARPVATLSVEAQERREVSERQYSDQDDRYR
jgi:DnaK suppressor protein